MGDGHGILPLDSGEEVVEEADDVPQGDEQWDGGTDPEQSAAHDGGQDTGPGGLFHQRQGHLHERVGQAFPLHPLAA